MIKWVVFVAFLASVLSLEYRVDTNEIIHSSKDDILTDILLTIVKNYLKDHGETSVAIPDASMGYKANILGVETDLILNLTGGEFRNPATIRRLGHSRFNHTGNSYLYSIIVTFSEMNVSFKNFVLDILGIMESGGISVDVGHNSLYLDAVIILHPCSINITRVEIRELEEVNVNISGLGVFNSLADEITEWVLTLFKSSFSSKIEEAVREKVRDTLDKLKC